MAQPNDLDALRLERLCELVALLLCHSQAERFGAKGCGVGAKDSGVGTNLSP